MKKLIKLDFNNTTRERKTEDSYSELYSHDKNNGSFEFEILNDTLTTEQVTALFKFTESNKIWKTTGTVEGNKVNVTFDTTLITRNETVICYLYFDEEQRTSDTFRFKFKVKVSEIDKMSRYEVKERFINNTVIVDRLDVVTKTELQEALKNVGGIATEGLLTKVKAEEIYAKKSEAVDNTNFELVKNRVLALELKTDKDTVYDDSELKGRISVLEAKEDNNTIYDDTNVRERLTALESKPNVDVNNLVTKDELASKNYLTEHQDLSNYALKSEIPTPYNDSLLNERVTALESKAIEGGAYNDTDLRNRVINLENKPPLDTSEFVTNQALESRGYIKDVSNLVTKEELESKNYLTTPYNDTSLKERVEVLENKVDKDTVYNDSELRERVTNLENKPNVDLSNYVTNEQLENKHYLTEHQQITHLATTSDLEALKNIAVTKSELAEKGYISDLSNYVTKQELHEATEIDYSNIVTTDELEPYAKKSELPTPYNDSALVSRVSALESKQDNDTVYNDTEVKQRLTALENKPSNQWEIHGTGMPNGVVTAEIGTTYVDKNKTNGALKWIKTTDGGNTGWKVFTGDTGWRTLPLINKRGNAKLQIRRINDEIIVKFDGLSWGWFGVDDLSKQGGNIVDKTIAGKQYTWIKLNVGRGNDVLPEGFRSAASLLSGLYGDLGDLLGSVYVGGTSDSNAIQLRYAMTRNELNSNILSQIRISPITFVTDDGWPTKLP